MQAKTDALIAAARRSPAGLAVVDSRGKWRPARHLRLLAERLCAVERGEVKRLMVFMPPRSGKSELISHYTPPWYVGRNPDKRVMLASYGAALASTWGRKARDVLEEWGPALYNVRVSDSSKAADRWDIAGHDGGMVTAGVGGPLTGRGADLLILDDYLKDSEEAASEVIRAKHVEWWQGTARTRLQPGGAVVLLATRWHEADLAGALLSEMRDGGEQWEVLSLPALAEENDALGREPGEPLWPEMFDLNSLLATKRAVGPYYWAAMFQQSPTFGEGGIFNRSDFRYFSLEDDRVVLRQPDGSTREWGVGYCQKFNVVDLAVSEKQTSDFTVLAEMWVTPEQDMLVRSIIRARIAGPDQADFIATHHAGGPIKVEAIGYQTALVQQLLRRGLPVEPVYPDKDKVTRASAAGVLYRGAKVYHLAGAEWLHDFEAELLAFPAGEHDDQCLTPDTPVPVLSDERRRITLDEDHAMVVKPASDVEVGDRVLTHTGKRRRITQVINREHDGEVIVVKPQGSWEVALTPEHPVLRVRNEARRRYARAHLREVPPAPEWTTAGELCPGDAVLEPIDTHVREVEQIDLAKSILRKRFTKQGRRSQAGLYLSALTVGEDTIEFANPRSRPLSRFVPVCESLCRLIGYYLAEGSRGRHNVTWSFNEKETDYHADVRQLLAELFDRAPSTQTRGGATILSLSSMVLHDFFGQFGRGARNKIIPSWVAHLPPELQRAVIIGAWRGDGCIRDRGFNYVSASRDLIVGLQMLLYRQGIVGQITIGRPDGTEGGVIKGRRIGPSGPLYHLNVGGAHGMRLADVLGVRQPECRPSYHGRIVDGQVRRVLRRVERRPYRGLVHNFEVEEDHTYQAGGFVVHNCDVIAYAARALPGISVQARKQRERGKTHTGGLLKKEL